MSAAQVRHAAARRDQPQVVYARRNKGGSIKVASKMRRAHSIESGI
jgi:hypothetical protein